MRATLGGNPGALTSGSPWQKLLLWVVTVALAFEVVGTRGQSSGSASAIQLFNNSPYCNNEGNGTKLICDLSNNTMQNAELPTSNWEGRKETHVIGAKSLTIRGQCMAEKKELFVTNCERVDTRKGDDGCRVRLIMRNSSAERIAYVASLLRVTDSSVKTVDLDGIEQFDFVSSSVIDLKVRATLSKSTIVSSDVRLVRSVVLQGSFNFEVDGSSITDIRYLLYNSSNEGSSMTDVRIGTVRQGGMVVSNGKLTLMNVTIGDLRSRAIRVEGAGELLLDGGTIQSASYDSIIMEGGTITLTEVTLAGRGSVSFTVSDTAGGLVPLILALGGTSSTNWTAVSAAIAFATGLIVSAGVFCLIMRRRRSAKSGDHDGMELLANNNTSMSPEPSKRPDGKQQQQQQQKQEITNDDAEEDVYEEYDEIIQMAPPKPSVMNLLPNKPHPPPPTTLPTERPDMQRQQRQEEEEEEYAEIDVDGDPHQPWAVNSQAKKGFPFPSLNHLAQAKNQSPPTAAPSLPKTLPPAPPSAQTPDLRHPAPPTTAPPKPNATGPGAFSQPPSARKAPPPPQRLTSVKKAPAPSPSSLSDERDRLTPPPPPPPDEELLTYDDIDNISLSTKPSFLHTDRNPKGIPSGSEPPPRNFPKPGQAGGAPPGLVGGRPRPPVPVNKPTLPFAGPKPTGMTPSAGDEEEDIYETVEDH